MFNRVTDFPFSSATRYLGMLLSGNKGKTVAHF